MPMFRPAAALGQFLIKSTWFAESGAKQGEAKKFVRSVTSLEAQVTMDTGDVPAVISWDLIVHREDAKSANGKGNQKRRMSLWSKKARSGTDR
jgi:O-glycosyl hydrolase